MGNASRKPVTPLVAESALPPEAEEVDEDYLDPRSPTPDVARTPISGKDGAMKHKITKNADLSNTLDECQPEEKIINNNPILSAVIRNHLQMYDPRSPTQEIERTPIVLAPNGMVRDKCNGELNGSISFESECDDKNAMDPDVISESLNRIVLTNTTLDSTFSDPEPLGSSTASQDAIEKEASPIAPKVLLETNFDYVSPPTKETDDTTVKIETLTPASLPNKIKSKYKLAEEDPRSPSQGIDRTPIVLPLKETITRVEEVEDMTEESLVAALQNGINDLRRTPAEPTNVGLLIYEDNSPTENTPRSTQSATKNARTPLSCMKNKTEKRAKSDAAFVDAKKKLVSRIPKRISKIPRLQKSMSLDLTKTNIEHENTPPVSSRDIWDRNSSVVL